MDQSTTPTDIRRAIGVGKAGKPRSSGLQFVIVIIVLLALGGVAGYFMLRGGDGGPVFLTLPAERDDLTVTVSAVGELAPLNQVDVGTEVSGTLDEVLVDNNDRVTAGQLLARINTDQLQAQLQRARANLLSAQARVGEAQANLADAQRTLNRTQELQTRGVATQDALDTALSARDRTQASLASAQAQVEVSQADVSAAETSLSKAEIYSPVDGVVLDRKVDPGQTVAAQMQTPVLFTLAEDLTQMELKVAIDEADVGQVREGQEAEFTVDAYRNRSFPAQITRVRYNASTTEGVVTYETLLKVDNSELLLRPGMTASAVITVAKVDDALLVPNEAVRFRPEDWGLGPLSGFPEPADESVSAILQNEGGDDGQGAVWVLRSDDRPERVELSLGATDGRRTIVTGGSLQAGDKLITGLDEDS